jgi:hypothetical protein
MTVARSDPRNASHADADEVLEWLGAVSTPSLPASPWGREAEVAIGSSHTSRGSQRDARASDLRRRALRISSTQSTSDAMARQSAQCPPWRGAVPNALWRTGT